MIKHEAVQFITSGEMEHPHTRAITYSYTDGVMVTWLPWSMVVGSSNKKTNRWWREKSMRWDSQINPVVAAVLLASIFSTLIHIHTHIHRTHTQPQTHSGWQRLNMSLPAQWNLHSSKLSSPQSHSDSNDPETTPFWEMQFKEKMSLWRGEARSTRRRRTTTNVSVCKEEEGNKSRWWESRGGGREEGRFALNH